MRARPVSRLLAAALAVGWASVGAAAESGAARVSLGWSAPAGCPDREQVLAETLKLLGDAPAGRPLVARGAVSQSEEGFVLVLATELNGSHGTRHLQAARCADLAQPAALVLALAIDPDALSRIAESKSDSAAATPAAGSVSSAVGSLPPIEKAPSPLPPPTPAPEPTAKPGASRKASVNTEQSAAAAADPRLDAPPQDDGPTRASDLFVRVGAGGAVDVGTLPDAAFGGVFTVAGHYERFELEARGALYGNQTKAVGQSAGGELALVSGGLGACYRVLDVGNVAPCAGAEGSRLSGKGVGVSDPGSGAVWIWSGVLGARAAQPLTDTLALWVRVDAQIALNQPRFVLENVGAVHEPARLSGRGALGAEVRFP